MSPHTTTARTAATTLLLSALAFAPFVITTGPDRWEGPKRLWIARTAVLLATIAVAAGIPIRMPRALLPAAAIALLAFARAQDDRGIAVAAHWTACIAIAAMARSLLRDWTPIRAVLAGVCILTATIGLAQVYGWNALPQIYRPAATLGNPNLAAAVVVATLPFLLALPRTARIPAAAPAAAYLICAGCLTAIGAGTIQLALALQKRRAAAVLIAAGLAIIAMSAKTAPRRRIWAGTARLALRHPFGIGTGHSPWILPRLPEADGLPWRRAHCDPLQVTTELGWIAIPLLAWAAAAAAGKPSPERLALAGLAVMSLTSFPAYCAIPPLIAAVCLAGPERQERAPRTTSPRPRHRPPGAAHMGFKPADPETAPCNAYACPQPC